MTEDEAKTKWCPQARADKSDTTNARAINRFQENDKQLPKGTKCIGSVCMAWRWALKPNPSYNPQQGAMWPQPRPPVPMYVRDETSGGCGLAGAPQ